MTLDELITALESATGPSREMDAEIAALLSGDGRAKVAHDGWWLNGECWPTKAPNYTTSIDAALTLVPEGASWRIENWKGEISAKVQIGDCVSYGGTHVAATALTIAALKARRTAQ